MDRLLGARIDGSVALVILLGRARLGLGLGLGLGQGTLILNDVMHNTVPTSYMQKLPKVKQHGHVKQHNSPILQMSCLGGKLDNLLETCYLVAVAEVVEIVCVETVLAGGVSGAV